MFLFLSNGSRDFNAVGVAFPPDKTDAPLVIDSDTVLPLAVPVQRLKPVAWRRCQVPQFRGRIQHHELFQCRPLNGLKPPHSLTVKKAVRLL
jgi:hypothetical protein